jgi:hypothetical protein
MQPVRQENLSSGPSIIDGRIKSGELMKIYLTVWLLSIATGCSVNSSAKMAGVYNENTAVHGQSSNRPDNRPPAGNEASNNSNCNDPNGNCMGSKKQAAQGQNSNAPDENRSPDAENLKTTVVENEDSKPLDCSDPNAYSLVVVADPERESQNPGTAPRVLNIVAGDEIRTAIKVPTDSDAQNFSLSSTEKTKEGFEITIEYGTRYYYKKQFDFICKEGDLYLYKVKVESFDKFDPKSRAKWDRKEIEIRPDRPVGKFSIFDYLTN